MPSGHDGLPVILAQGKLDSKTMHVWGLWASLRRPASMISWESNGGWHPESVLMHTAMKLEEGINNLIIFFSINSISLSPLLRPVLLCAPGTTGTCLPLWPMEQKDFPWFQYTQAQCHPRKCSVHRSQTFTFHGNAFLSTAASSWRQGGK